MRIYYIEGFLLISLLFSAGLFLAIPHEVSAFVQPGQYSAYEPAGFFSGVWHGFLAPWSLIDRWFVDNVVMYAVPNTGWFYDAGFLIGVAGSLPLGWIAAIISVAGQLL